MSQEGLKALGDCQVHGSEVSDLCLIVLLSNSSGKVIYPTIDKQYYIVFIQSVVVFIEKQPKWCLPQIGSHIILG